MASIFKYIQHFLSAIFFSLVLAGCVDEADEVSEFKPEKKLTCHQAPEYIGSKVRDLPDKQFSKLRMVEEGNPATMDFVKDRATIIYNEGGYIVSAYCG